MIQTAQACLRATNSTIGRIILYKQLHYTRVTALITFILGAVYINAQDNILCPIPVNICDMASITEVDLSMVTKDSNLSGDILAINNNTSAAQPTAECHHTDSGIDCHQFIITRPNESISGFSTLLQYGNPCGGQFNVDSVYIEMGKTCSKLIDPDKNTPVFFEFSDCINEMTVTMCSNRGETVSFCGIQVSTFEVVASYQNGSDCDDGNVIVVVSNSGPSGPYLYSWLNEDGVEVSTDASPSPPLASGDYTIIVTDGPSEVTAIDQITVEASGSNCCELTINGTGSPVDIKYCDLPSIDPNDLFTNMGYATSGACGDVLIQICPINFVECTAGTYDIDFLLTDDMGTVEIADDTHLTICSSINITVTQPTITSNPSTNQDLNCNPSEIVAPVFTVTDPCDTSDPSDPSDPSATIEEGDVIIDGCMRTQTWTATYEGACQNAEPVEIMYTWTEDDEAPQLTVPDDEFLGCDPVKPTMQSVMAASSVIDNCGATISVIPGQITGDCTKTQIFTVTANDDCGDLSDTKSVTYTWTEDDEAPQLTVPDDEFLGCDPLKPTMQSVMAASSVTDNCGATISVTPGQITGDCTKTQIFTVTANDDCGDLSDTKLVTYTWTEDDEAPQLTVPDDEFLGCDPVKPTMQSVMAASSVIDNCGATISVTPGQITGDCTKTQIFTVTANDDCGDLSESKSVTYTWTEDDQAPQLTVPDDEFLGCDPVKPTMQSVMSASSVTDNCGATISVSVGPITGDCTKTQIFTVTANDDCGDLSDTEIVTYTWTDDDEAPQLTVPDDEFLGCNPVKPTMQSVMAASSVTDNCEATISVSAGPITGDCTKSQTFTVIATDDCGDRSDTETVTFTWTEDNQAPMLTVPAGGDLDCNPDALPSMQSVLDQSSVIDNCGATISVSPGQITGDCTKTQIFTVTATDNCGDLSDTKTVTYTWTEDNQAPVLTVPAGGDLDCNPDALPSMQSVLDQSSVTDNCGATISVSAGQITGDCTKTQIFTVTATDDCGDLSDTETVTYTWSEGQSVTLTVPEDQTEDSCQDQEAINEAFQDWLDQVIFSGGCNAEIMDGDPEPPHYCGGEVKVMWTVTSDCGEEVSDMALFTVEDSPPIVGLPVADMTPTECLDSDVVENEFQEWLVDFSNVSGGCDLSVSYNITETIDNLDGTITINTYTVSSLSEINGPTACDMSIEIEMVISDDCHEDVIIAATFIVPQGIRGIEMEGEGEVCAGFDGYIFRATTMFGGDLSSYDITWKYIDENGVTNPAEFIITSGQGTPTVEIGMYLNASPGTLQVCVSDAFNTVTSSIPITFKPHRACNIRCENYLYVSQHMANDPAQLDFHAAGVVESDNSIPAIPGNTTEFTAKFSVNLLPGFCVEPGAQFEAQIANRCDEDGFQEENTNFESKSKH